MVEKGIILSIIFNATVFIEKNTDYVYEGDPFPEVEFIPDEYMEVEYYGPDTVARAELDGVDLPKVLAFYNHDIDTMYLLESFSPVEDDYIIYHEMVHWYQDINGEMDGDYCRGSLEPPAYEISDLWLEETGREELKSNGLFVHLLAAECATPHY